MAKYNMSEQDAEKVLSKLLKKIDTVKLMENIMVRNYSPSYSGGRSMSENDMYAINKNGK